MRRGGLALAALLLCGCGGGGDAGAPPPVDDSIYVEVMARLVLLDSTVTPTASVPRGASADSLRERVLERWSVDADGLLEYARRRGTRPRQMQAIWKRIRELSDSLEAADWVPAGAGPDTARARPDTAGPRTPPPEAAPTSPPADTAPSPADTLAAADADAPTGGEP